MALSTEPAQMHRWLKISEPTTVPTPSELCVMKSATSELKTSGELAPAAMIVAPAMSSGIAQRSQITDSAGTKRSSQTTLSAQKRMSVPVMSKT